MRKQSKTRKCSAVKQAEWPRIVADLLFHAARGEGERLVSVVRFYRTPTEKGVCYVNMRSLLEALYARRGLGWERDSAGGRLAGIP